METVFLVQGTVIQSSYGVQSPHQNVKMEINIPGGQQSQCEKGGKYTEPETVCKIPDSFSRKNIQTVKSRTGGIGI